jgi:Zn-dependent protease with chaperone function
VSKKTNTLLFILGATVFNILSTVICFFVLYLLFVWLLVPRISNQEAVGSWGLIVCMIAAFVLSFLIYRIILKQLLKKVAVEKYFDPIFGNQKKKN